MTKATAEPSRATDVTALLASIVDDMADAGMAVTMKPASSVICDCRPAALKLTRVFQPFYRLEGSRSRETGGVGLGLAIALSIVEALGGALALANRPEGGLRARITLPR